MYQMSDIVEGTRKEQKEHFVTGLTGTTPMELFLLCSTSITGILFYWACTILASNLSRFRPNHIPLSVPVVDALIQVLAFPIPMILCQTVFLYPFGVAYMIFQLLLVVVVVVAVAGKTIISQNNKSIRRPRIQEQQLQGKVKEEKDRTGDGDDDGTLTPPNTWSVNARQYATITIYRSSLLCLTIVAILAVDFHVFPRRFAKTETHGYSLMDMGAASFVVASGLVSHRARNVFQNLPSITTNHYIQPKRFVPLAILGLLRYVTHQELDYQEHASEYGIHWNFFWTLALLQPVAAILSTTTSKTNIPHWLCPLIVFGLYQMCLSIGGLQKWIEDAPRKCPKWDTTMPPLSPTSIFLCDIVYANREGIFGCFSYAALYLLSEWIAYKFYWQQQSPTTTTTPTSSVSSSIPLYRVTIMLGIVWRILDVYVTVSRRSTNLPFVAWVLFVNVFQLTAIDYFVNWFAQSLYAFRIDNTIVATPLVPTSFKAINRHGLFIFLIANLLTGAVNLSINTLEVNHMSAVTILGLYTCAVGGCAILLEQIPALQRRKETKIKHS